MPQFQLLQSEVNALCSYSPRQLNKKGLSGEVLGNLKSKRYQFWGWGYILKS